MPKHKIFDVDLTSMGNWYYTSWKGNLSKSGSIFTNIGVHFYDMLYRIFVNVVKNIIHVHIHDRTAGYLEFKRARVRCFLSINEDVLPNKVKAKGQCTYKSIQIEDEELEFSEGVLYNFIQKVM